MSLLNKGSRKDLNSAQYYKDLIAKVFFEWRPRLGAAPNKSGWDPIFKKQIPSRREILMARDAMIQDIATEARIFGIDLKLGETDEPYVSPFSGEEGK